MLVVVDGDNNIEIHNLITCICAVLFCDLNPSHFSMLLQEILLTVLSHFSYSDREDLIQIYSAYLKPVLNQHLSKHAVWSKSERTNTLAATMVTFYEQLRATFSVDEYSHYTFTPRNLTMWVVGLLRYGVYFTSHR